jgi:ribosomal protein S18 acetylase RimI-like enzyme
MRQPTKYVIRKAKQEDLARCLQIDHTYETDYVWQMSVMTEGAIMRVTFREERLPRAMHVNFHPDFDALQKVWQQEECFLVAEHRGTIWGYGTMLTDALNGSSRITALAVDVPQRRRGIGSALLHEMRTWARKAGSSRLLVETQTKNVPGIRFCYQHGLSFCGFNDRYYANQDIALFFGQDIR